MTDLLRRTWIEARYRDANEQAWAVPVLLPAADDSWVVYVNINGNVSRATEWIFVTGFGDLEFTGYFVMPTTPAAALPWTQERIKILPRPSKNQPPPPSTPPPAPPPTPEPPRKPRNYAELLAQNEANIRSARVAEGRRMLEKCENPQTGNDVEVFQKANQQARNKKS